MSSSRGFDRPPSYHSGSEHKFSNYAPSRDMYGAEMHSQPAYSYYAEDEIQHFYKWTSPPGIVKIMALLIVVMCVGIFACVASTLPWDLDYYAAGTGMGMGGTGAGTQFHGSSYGGFGSNYGYAFGYGGNYIDPRVAKKFMIAMGAISFIFAMGLFVLLVSKAHWSKSRRFFLIVIIGSGVLGGLVLIATIVYIMGVNPSAQASGSVFYNQVVALCSQFYSPATSGVFINQYLYHYCVVEPQEAIAIVFGFLVVAAFAIILFFAIRTRKKIGEYGKMNILWEKERVEEEEPPNVEDWVKNVSGEPEEVPPMAYEPEVNGSSSPPHYEERSRNGTPAMPEAEVPLMNNHRTSNLYSSSSDATTKPPQKRPPRKRRAGRAKRPNTEGYDTDYTTGAESCEELDAEDDEWESKYPPITSDQQRQEYKRDFDSGLQEYKRLQAELDEVNKKISQLDKQLDDLQEGTEEYQAVADEYNDLKDLKKSEAYKDKKMHCKQLKGKLSHIKSLVSDYDNQK
ncbi:occludin b [Latimeria chalumnae]|uniref:occludin b n=1 Tax=Latimeria chalumnae TaxID=7897 RepID=UPI0003C10CA2|nr:PREDICTED: occludin [Latimeria chalumnae]|eukprot:XP_006004445.1 PREDICTED: occludin [Latimeria chalumnae]